VAGLNPTKAEITALVALLEQNWETPEVLAKALIGALDAARASRTTYVAVLQFGNTSPWYAGLGPYPGAKSARQAVARFPGSTVASAIGVVPLLSDEGLAQKLREVG
jgi:hypothetical protein